MACTCSFRLFQCTFASLCAKSLVPRTDLTCRAVLLQNQRVVADPRVWVDFLRMGRLRANLGVSLGGADFTQPAST